MGNITYMIFLFYESYFQNQLVIKPVNYVKAFSNSLVHAFFSMHGLRGKMS